MARLKDGRIWTLLTTMSELKGHEESVGFDRPMGAKHGAERNRKTWKEEREVEAQELGYSRQPYCVIVGGGQGGIALGARLRASSMCRRSSSRKMKGLATAVYANCDRLGIVLAKDQSEIPSSLKSQIDHLPELDEASPPIVPSYRR